MTAADNRIAGTGGLKEMTEAPAASLNERSMRNLASIAIDSIRLDIVRCVLKPGEKLRIQSLCDRYDINSSAIREALSRLVTEELVEAVDQRGFRVCQVSRSDLLDLTQTRIGVESLALAQAIELGSAEWESHVLAAYHRLSKCALPPVDKNPGSSTGAWEVLHRQFHETLISGCRSRWLLSICRALFEKSERYRCLAEDYTKPSERDALKEHKELMDAALGRDATLARARLEEHFTRTTQVILAGHDDSQGSSLRGAVDDIGRPTRRSRTRSAPP
jgi:GntR family transcriptional regulator, carbon starvation induced regulator